MNQINKLIDQDTWTDQLNQLTQLTDHSDQQTDRSDQQTDHQINQLIAQTNKLITRSTNRHSDQQLEGAGSDYLN